MAKDVLAEQLRRLKELGEGPEAIAALRQALKSTLNGVVEKAAQIVRSRRLLELRPELLAAFDRMAGAGVDAGCTTKFALIGALHELDHDDPVIYLRGIRCVQKEAVWGGSTDTAGGVRASSALALASLPLFAGVVLELTPLLVDAERQVRSAAAQALANSGRPEAEAVLRLKALTGDQEPEVLLDTFVALLQLSPTEPTLRWVTGFFGHRDENVRNAAVLAVGLSRVPSAFEVLREQVDSARGAVNETVLTAIASLRDERAADYLLTQVREAPVRVASAVIKAMGIHRDDERLLQRVRAAVEERDDVLVRRAFAEAFG
jgi:HEAT repeat protein